MTITVEPRWFVCIDGCPVGSMYDQFDRFEVIFKNKYPFHKTGNYFKDVSKATEAAAELEAHVREVMELPEKMKKGKSAQYWKLQQDEEETF
jgi:hypothetical protein